MTRAAPQRLYSVLVEKSVVLKETPKKITELHRLIQVKNYLIEMVFHCCLYFLFYLNQHLLKIILENFRIVDRYSGPNGVMIRYKLIVDRTLLLITIMGVHIRKKHNQAIDE